MALSTLRPATSPRLSVIKLDFTSPSSVPAENSIPLVGNDLQLIAEEIARIEREFKGAVDFTLLCDSRFGAVLGTLNVMFSFVVWGKVRGHVDSSSSVPCRSFSSTFVEMGRSLCLVDHYPHFYARLMNASCGSPSTIPLDRSLHQKDHPPRLGNY